jgi:hypothetical protein
MIKHICADHVVDARTETLIIGTFNPNVSTNTADFFYGRPKNALWTFLAKAYDVEDLKRKSKAEKLNFMRTRHIDFVDLISEIGEAPRLYEDRLLDRQTNIVWNDVVATIAELKFLKRVCVSRKRFADVPNIGKKVAEIQTYLAGRPILFRCLHTPARAHVRGWPEWSEFLDASCKNC